MGFCALCALANTAQPRLAESKCRSTHFLLARISPSKKYTFDAEPSGARRPCTRTPWIGVFECARSRHLEVLFRPAANAVVVTAANAVYIVDPGIPEQFSGFIAPVEINGVTEPLDGYGARFCGCGGRVLAVELKQCGPELENEEEAPSVVPLRTEDGTILRSRFRLARHYWKKSAAAW